MHSTTDLANQRDVCVFQQNNQSWKWQVCETSWPGPTCWQDSGCLTLRHCWRQWSDPRWWPCGQAPGSSGRGWQSWWSAAQSSPCPRSHMPPALWSLPPCWGRGSSHQCPSWWHSCTSCMSQIVALTASCRSESLLWRSLPPDHHQSLPGNRICKDQRL